MDQQRALAHEDATLLQRVSSSVGVLGREYADLRAKYPDRYVALHRGKPIAVGKSLDEVIAAVRKAKVEENEVVVEFVPSTDAALVV
jgi:ABC-type hemin transport system ATPase subunit